MGLGEEERRRGEEVLVSGLSVPAGGPLSRIGTKSPVQPFENKKYYIGILIGRYPTKW